MTCLITGCTLRTGSQWVGGDLHQIGTAYVFNAILRNGEAAWQFAERPHYTKEIDASFCAQYLEKRGVIVFDQRAVLNAEALAYLRKSEEPSAS